MTLAVGVVGVGSMGNHHARALSELSEVELVGVTDADMSRAREVAAKWETDARSLESLLEIADAVSIATPTAYHADIAWTALGNDVHVLVEKPFVEDPDEGRLLVNRANDRNLVLQVGHIERFNPAVTVLDDILEETEIVAIDARRLGPPLDRTVDNSVVLDLMIHDIDMVLSLVDEEIESVSTTSAAGFPHVSANLQFADGPMASLTASRITHRRVRELTVTTPDFLLSVDYFSRSVKIYRQSLPEYLETDGELRYRNESVVEQPVIADGEPLKNELESFVESIQTDSPPVVDGEDGLRALELALRIEESALVEVEPVAQNA